MRPSMYDIFSEVVLSLAKRSTCSRRAAVGALLFDDKNRVYGTGYNGSPRGIPHCDEIGCDLDSDGHCRTAVHGEVNAILQCAVMGRSTEGLHIFCTHSPCIRCAGVIVQAGITKVVFLTKYERDFAQSRALLANAGVDLIQYTAGGTV